MPVILMDRSVPDVLPLEINYPHEVSRETFLICYVLIISHL